MFHLKQKLANSGCPGYHHPHTILNYILSGRDICQLNYRKKCRCEQRKTVCLKDPKATSGVASSVLIKTLSFMRSLPSFGQLPLGDQLALLRHGWVPLFVLGLAQDKMKFEVTDASNSSILREILLGPEHTEKEADQPTLDKVHRLRTCLHRLRNLDLSPKEYAYLKGAVLFNPDIKGLSALLYIKGLQQEAHKALQEVTHHLHPGDTNRFCHILLAASSLQTVGHSLVTELFFRPVIGSTDMLHLLTEMLYV